MFVNWTHIKDHILKDDDIVGLGLAGVLAYESIFSTHFYFHYLFVFFSFFNFFIFPPIVIKNHLDTATKKLLPHGVSVDPVKGARSEFIYKFIRGIYI